MGRGGGTRDVSIPIDSTKDDILKEMLDIFFPCGNSVFGNASIMKFNLGNFKGDKSSVMVSVWQDTSHNTNCLKYDFIYFQR